MICSFTEGHHHSYTQVLVTHQHSAWVSTWHLGVQSPRVECEFCSLLQTKTSSVERSRRLWWRIQDELSCHILSRRSKLCSVVWVRIRPLSMGYLLQWQMFSSFWEMVCLLVPSQSYVDNVLQDRKTPGKSLELTLGEVALSIVTQK